MSDNIPYELLMVMLSKLPAEALLRFRCVCKAWCRMIDDPYLINIHRDHQLLTIHDFSDGVSRVLMVNKADKKFCSLSLNYLLLNSNNYGPKCFEAARVISYPMMFQETSFVSCNGLILVSHFCDGKLLRSIRNPLTQEVHVLPYDDEVKSPFYGFGYDSISDDYKVLTRSIEDERYASLYSLKSNSLKQINDFSHWITHWDYGVFSNGALHWIGKTSPLYIKSSSYVIVAFDLKTEDFRYYSLPTSIVSRLRIWDLDLSELGGCLSLSGHFDRVHLETWLMNDYGDENSWSMLFSIAKLEVIAHFIRIISYSKSKGLVLLKKDNTEFLLFDLKNNTVENVIIPDGLNIYSPKIFVASLVRINGSRKE